MKLCLVGGHLTPALALAQIAKNHHDSIIFIGREATTSDGLLKSQELNYARKEGWTFYSLNSPKLYHHLALSNLYQFPQFFSSLRAAFSVLKKQKPDCVVTFGSYLSVPVGLSAKLLGIPLVIHEQTSTAGLANRLLAPIATTVTVGFPVSRKNFPASKTVLVGNPLRQDFFQPKLKPPPWLSRSPLPLIYVTGGNQGSVTLNQNIVSLYRYLGTNFTLVHQCGGYGENRAQKLAQTVSLLPEKVARQIHLKEWLTGDEVAWCLQNAALVISRSGANTVSEIIYSAVPSILVPLPTSRFNEQLHNAQIIVNGGSGLILSQNELNEISLLGSIDQIMSRASTFRQKAQTLKASFPQNTATLLYQEVKKAVKHP